MEYECIEEIDAITLNEQVNLKLSMGWRLHGGVSVSVSESDDYRFVVFAQAMIKGE